MGANADTISMIAERIKYKQKLKKKSVNGGNVSDEQPSPDDVKVNILEKDDEPRPGNHIVRNIDYVNLERSLFMKQMKEYHELVAHVNIWAISLGFLVKMKRPPKTN